MEKISIIHVKIALNVLFHEVQSSEGQIAFELLQKYLEQQREKQIEQGTLIV